MALPKTQHPLNILIHHDDSHHHVRIMNTTASSLTGNEHNNYLVGNNGNDTLDGVALTASKFQLGTAANDSGDRIVYDQSSGKLYYDADGTGTTAAIQFATLSNKPGLVAADFLVVA